MAKIERPMVGIETWVTDDSNIRVLQLHYTADEEKRDPKWAALRKPKSMLTAEERAYGDDPKISRYIDRATWEMEQEIIFSARDGQRLFNLDDAATLEKSFPIPKTWTRYFGLDPHPRVPHAMLWIAVDPNGEAYCYRELWPSKAYGKKGNSPEDDNSFKIPFYVETIKWLESKENPENDGADEEIHRRVIDYEARAFGVGTADDPTMSHYQKRYEDAGRQVGLYLHFRDSKKDRTAGIELVNDWLRPRPILDADGKEVLKSRLHIFKDRCPELIHELKTNTWAVTTAHEAATQDPKAKELNKRNHLSDLVRYLCMDGLKYVPPYRGHRDTWKPVSRGVNF